VASDRAQPEPATLQPVTLPWVVPPDREGRLCVAVPSPCLQRVPAKPDALHDPPRRVATPTGRLRGRMLGMLQQGERSPLSGLCVSCCAGVG
jgi:hypothetical protein